MHVYMQPCSPSCASPHRLSPLTSSYTQKFPKKSLAVLIPDFQKFRKDFASVTAWLKRLQAGIGHDLQPCSTSNDPCMPEALKSCHAFPKRPKPIWGINSGHKGQFNREQCYSVTALLKHLSPLYPPLPSPVSPSLPV